MTHLDFDGLWKNHLFDYKDGDLLVLDDITRLNLADYEDTQLDSMLAVFCQEGRLQAAVEGREYKISEGPLFVLQPGQMVCDIMLGHEAKVKVIAFATRAIDRSLYLNKYVWQQVEYIKEHPLFHLDERERLTTSYYYKLMLLKTQGNYGNFQHDVVRLLFQTLILEFLMLVDRKKEEIATEIEENTNASIRQQTLIYRYFMRLLAESKGRVRSVFYFANMLNVSPKYLCKCVKDES